MSNDELVAFQLMLQNRVLRSSGAAYEDLFCSVMELAEIGFRRVKPQGKFGDRKNDGWVQEKGRYWQVYAPEEPGKREQEAIDKIEADFRGLYDFWQSVAPIQEFFFAFNDKYQGAYPTTEKALAKIKANHSLTVAAPFLARDLETRFLALPSDSRVRILGFPPSASALENLRYNELTEILHHLMQDSPSSLETESLNAPDFDEKLTFNGLGRVPADYLRKGAYQVHRVEEYFERNSTFSRSSIRDRLAALYASASGVQQAVSPPNTTSPDRTFFDMLNTLVPSATRQAQDACVVLLAYFFESCDIYEDPAQQKGG
jgi:hypothetical protein